MTPLEILATHSGFSARSLTSVV